ncbi:adenosylmethionine decarboxylase [Kamptonema animale CS-326]|jgi:S-adenosylmethionine decarboxylase|uniref:adenosylmethionine decarboxylase n=1 Tax=Kamptonema TaxID=1501433 RepID=UPI0001DAD38A|nr:MULTISPECIES: adenosylmethionine decarboxylase [Kamptonema]MDB9511591.1 adenosylmethionine decarboxylase [Kamptonema animale CS-326]CBN57133.1 adenosylmethionine decarboxylase proenzyme [Kamptonema sp. PCC 6506]
MKQLGTHLVVDAWQSPGDLLNDPERIRRALLDAIVAGEATLIDMCVHQFSPHGVTATVTLAESHIAIHTWPEYGYFAADLFFCGRGNPQRAMKVLQTALEAKEVRLSEFKRGFDPGVGILDSASSEQYAPCLVETSAARG